MIWEILPRFDWVRVSIDAGNEDSYWKTRRTHKSHYTRAWAHTMQLADAIKDKDSKTALGVGFVVTPESYLEIPEFADEAKSRGVHNIRFTAMFSTDDEKPFVKIYDDVRMLIAQVRREHETPEFAVYDNFGSRFDDLKQHAPDYKSCGYQHYTTYIGGDLKVYRCCVLAYNRRGLVEGGDLKRTRFDDFWRSQKRKDDLNGLNAMGCPRCQFNTKNRGLLYVMGNTASDVKPRHLEWP
jgi:MoaA/NifB/PqqE/SkfB family radical SAM enzyme